MDPSLNKAYQQGDLMSATPQRLQYLLIDGAIRFARQAKEHWENNDFEQGGEAMDRCEAILTEILKNVRLEGWAVADQIAGLYIFLLKSATLAHFKHDTELLDKVVSILETERETWRVLCETPIDSTQTEKTREDQASDTPVSAPITPLETPMGSDGLSLEA